MKHETPRALRFLDDFLSEARRLDLHRDRPRPPERPGLSFCSNDYLALASRGAPEAPCGAGASRLVSGDRRLHADLEAASAELVGQPASLAFTSGYGANVGLLSTLAGPGDLIISDALNHASLIDGARLSRASVRVVPHLDIGAVAEALAKPREGRAFIVTESYFSMDADSPDLRALRRIADENDAALVVDEAHALGVLGPGGRGLCAEREVSADALVGTYGKAFGAAGAFVAGCPALVDWLWNRARTFVFSTGLSPVLAAAALGGIAKAQAEPDRRQRVLEAATALRAALGALGLELRGHGHIIPWIVGDPKEAVEVTVRLRDRGVDVRAIRPPSVPLGTARLRWTVTSAHGPADIKRAVEALKASLPSRLRCGPA